jgi:parallel beta-helix repeat protein
VVRGNRVQDGIFVSDAASPRLEGNEVWGNAFHGIEIGDAGTNPFVRANRVHDGGQPGIFVHDGASPRLEENEIWANRGKGLFISKVGTSPTVKGNAIRDGLSDGIYVCDGASPDIRGNTITGNAKLAIRVEDAEPTIGRNIFDHPAK